MSSPAPSPAISRSKSPPRMSSTAAPKIKRAKKAAASRKVSSGRPPTLAMITRAINEMKDRKGSSAQAIRKFILSKYPDMPVNFLPSMLKRAFAAGLKSGALVRPKGSTTTGASGRFRVGKAAAPKKAAPKKAASKKKVAKKASKAKKTVRKQAGKVKKAKSIKKKPTTKKTAKKTTKKVAKKTKPTAHKAKTAKPKMVK